MINVFIVDDHQLFIDGLKAILVLDEHINYVGAARDGEDLLQKLEQKLEGGNEEIHVIILDIKMPNLNGIETAKIIIDKYPNIKILIVSMHKKKNYIVNLMKIGVSGFVLKEKSKESLIGAIHQVYANNPYFDLEIIKEATSIPNKKDVEGELTKREVEVLCKIGEGYTTKEIAKQLDIGQTTVNTYRRNLLLKLEVPNDKHLVRYAIKNGYIDL